MNCCYSCSCCSLPHLARSSWLMPLIPARYYRRTLSFYPQQKGEQSKTHLRVSSQRYETKDAPQWSFGLFSCCRLPLNTDGDSSVAWSLLTRFPFLSPSLYPLPTATPSLSRARLPEKAVYLAVRLSDSLSFSCGRRPPSVDVTANRHTDRPFQTVI